MRSTHDWLVDFYAIAANPTPVRIGHALRELERIYDIDHVWLDIAKSCSNAVDIAFTSSDEIDSIVKQYVGYYRAIDPRIKVLNTMSNGETFICHHHLDDAFVRDNEVFQDFLIPNGRRYVIATRLMDLPHFRAHFAFNHFVGREPFEGKIVRSFNTLTRHLINWMNLALQFSRLRGERQALSNALDSARDGMAVFDQKKRLVLGNAAAMSLLVQERQAGRFALRGDDRARLDVELSNAIHTRVGSATRINLNFPEGLRTIELKLVPMPDAPWLGFGRDLRMAQSPGDPTESRDFRFGDQPEGSILATFKLFVRADKDKNYLRNRVGLNAAEAQIAVQFFNGRSVKEIVELRATSLRTLRTQMTSIMAKFGVRSLQDLLRLSDTVPEARQR